MRTKNLPTLVAKTVTDSRLTLDNIVIISLFAVLTLSIVLPATARADCEGTLGPADFSLYKNRPATFTSKMDAGTMQKYKIEWFIGGKRVGFVIKNAGESFVLKKTNLTSQSFSVTGFHQKGEKWSLSRNKIFPDANGRIQVRFDDGACDNSFVTSPDLKVIIKID
jgi:hypothetical protein